MFHGSVLSRLYTAYMTELCSVQEHHAIHQRKTVHTLLRLNICNATFKILILPFSINSQTEDCVQRRILCRPKYFRHISTKLILRTLEPFNVFILLNGWICLHGVLLCSTKPALSWFSNALKIITLSFIHSFLFPVYLA